MQPVIELKSISKRYRLGRKLPGWRALLGKSEPAATETHWALRDINLELRPGESMAIVGPNGAGKTTLLKILSRVTRPTVGEMIVSGRLAALIELGAGFHPDLTGRENIFLNAAILGMHKSEIRARFDEIVAFSGVSEFLDTPVKRYSSGMHARLGFAIAAHLDPQILLVDEVLAVGDHAFQTRCYARMAHLRSNGTTLIFVSHNLDAVRRVCDRGLVLYGGQVAFQGGSAEAVLAYSDAIRDAARNALPRVPLENGLAERVMTFDAEIERIRLFDASRRQARVLTTGAAASVVLDVRFNRDVRRPIFSIRVDTPEGELVYATTTRWIGMETHDYAAGERCCIEFSVSLPLLDGTYELGADIAAADLTHYYDVSHRAVGFQITGSGETQGLVNLGAQVTVKDEQSVHALA
jgi:ABC-type polysaccharide/polyol phosphate transport system ATPase subunit